MKKSKINLAGSNKSNEPRHIKEIIDELLQSDLLFKDVYPNTELDIDLKLYTHEPGRLELGEAIEGAIVHDGEYHFTFIEIAPEPDLADVRESDEPIASEKKSAHVKRNPIVIPGNCVNLHQKDDGSFYLTFRRPVLSPSYTWKDFCIEAVNEILSLIRLVEKVQRK